MPRSRRNECLDRRRGAYVIVGAFSIVIPFILFSYFAFGNQSKAPATLQLVHIVFRHGDRTPTHFYPNDPYKDPKFWPDGLGALTKKGKQQIYDLGKTLRERYGGFLSEYYHPEDIYVLSSDHDRCLMSAQLCLASLYPPVGEQIWNKNLNWQPIPVHTIPRDMDKYITGKKKCQRYDVELNNTYRSDYMARIDKDNAELYQYLSKHSGMEVKNLKGLESLYNTLEVEVNNNFELPAWADKVYDEKFRNLATLGLSSYTFTPTMKRLKGGPILAQVVDHMTRKILGSSKPVGKLYLYSAHDVTLISVLRALGFEDLSKPDNGASMIIELHQSLNGGDHLVEVLYLNNTEVTTPIKLKIPGCDVNCPLRDFLGLTKPVIPVNWEAECEE